MAGRLGVDPSPWLLPLDPAAKDYWSKLRGACYAEKQWAAKLVGPLKELLDTPRQNRDQRNAIYAALVNLGERDYVTQRLQASAERDDKRILKRIDSLLARRQFGPDAICTLS